MAAKAMARRVLERSIFRELKPANDIARDLSDGQCRSTYSETITVIVDGDKTHPSLSIRI